MRDPEVCIKTETNPAGRVSLSLAKYAVAWEQFQRIANVKRNVTMLFATLFAYLLITKAAQCAEPARKQQLAIVGATLVDVGSFGKTHNDILRSVILVNDGVIIAVGAEGELAVPPGITAIDGSGSYVIPGLIDGFGAMRTRGFAAAYLYEGVTTVFVQEAPKGEDGEQRITSPQRGPRMLLGGMIGGYSVDGTQSREHPWTRHRLDDRRLPAEKLRDRIDQLSDNGFHEVLVGYDVWPDQLDVLVGEAKRRNIVVLTELAFTTYPYAVRAGVDTLLHNDRYQTAIALPQDLLAYADDPVGMSGAPAYRDVCATSTESDIVAAFGMQLASAHTALMPTLSIEATADDVDIPNPWSLPAAVFVKAAELDDPVNPSTGERPYLASQSPERRLALKECAVHRQILDKKLFELGAHFLAGSGSPSYGIIPGSGLHMEVKLLHRIGLTPREAISAATSNFSDIYGWHDIGLVAPGRRADIVLLNSDPRANIDAIDDIRLVMLDGQIVDRAALLSSAANGRGEDQH